MGLHLDSYTILVLSAAGAAAAAATLLRAEWGLLIIIFSMLLSPEISVGKVPGRDVVFRIEDILLVLVGFTWFAKSARHTALMRDNPLRVPILLFVIACVLSSCYGVAFHNARPLKSLLYLAKYAEYFILYFMVVETVRTRRQVQFFTVAIFVTYAITVCYAATQIGSQPRVSAPFEGEVGQPNTLGAYMSFIIALAMGIMSFHPSASIKGAMIAVVLASVYPFQHTLSRSSYIAFVPMCMAMVLLQPGRRRFPMLLAVLVLLAALFSAGVVKKRLASTFTPHHRSIQLGSVKFDSSFSDRVTSWGYVVQDWLASPIFGYGVGGYGFIDGQFMTFLGETGIVGLAAFLWLLWNLFGRALAISRSVEDGLLKGLAVGMVAGMVGLLVHAVGSNTFILIRVMEPFWFVAGMVTVFPRLEDVGAPAPGDLRPYPSGDAAAGAPASRGE